MKLKVEIMLTIVECRKILGKKYEKFTDEQIEKIRDWVYMIVQIFKNNRDKIINGNNENSSNIRTCKHGRTSK